MNTHTKHERFLSVYKIIIIALTVVSSGLCAICTAFFFDYSPGYFKDTALRYAFLAAVAITCICSLSSFLIFKKSFKLNSPDSPSSPEFIFSIPACGFLFYTISVASHIFIGGNNSPMLFAQALFSIVSFIYFLSLSINIKASASIKTLLGLSSIIAPVLIVAKSYFDYYSVMNSPEKTLLQICLVAFALYIINEVRFLWGEAYHRLHLALSGIIFLLSTCYTLHKLLIIINSDQVANAEDIALCALMATIAAYALLRILFAAPAEDEESNNDTDSQSQESICDSTSDECLNNEISQEIPDQSTDI